MKVSQLLSMQSQQRKQRQSRRNATRLIACVVALFCLIALTPAVAGAAPKVTFKQSVSEFTKVVGSVTGTYLSSESGSAVIKIADANGRVVAKFYRSEVKASSQYTFRWAGRATSNNEANIESGDYVRSGTYAMQLTVTGKTGPTTAKRTVIVRSSPRPKITSPTVPTSITPAVVTNTKVMTIRTAVSVSNDVVVRIINTTSGLRVLQTKWRNAKAATALELTWDGQIKIENSATLPSGISATVGDVAPPGIYKLVVISNGAKFEKSFTVKPTPVSSLLVTGPTGRMRYGATFQLRPIARPRGAADRSVVYTSSNTAVATVSSAGLVTALRKEGSAIITIKAHSNPDAVAQVKINVSDSLLKQTDFLAVPTWLQYQRSRVLKGIVSSNYTIKTVRLTVTDVTGAKVEIDQSVSPLSKSYDINTGLNALVSFSKLSAGKKTLKLIATDSICTRTLYTQTFYVIGPTRYKTFWKDRVAGTNGATPWVYPLDIKRTGNVSLFGSVRDGGARAHAAIDLIEPAGTKVFAMADGVVERISTTYYEGTGAVQIKHTDGSVIWYCEVKALSTLKVGAKVKQNQRIATIQTNNYGTAMLHLEAYSGKATGSLYQGANMSTYDNVTPVRFCRRRDLIYPDGVLLLPVPVTRTTTSPSTPTTPTP